MPRFATGALVRWRYGKGASASAKEKEFVDGAASYIVSAAHAVVISGFGLKILSLLWPTPEADKFYVNDGMKDLSTIDLIREHELAVLRVHDGRLVPRLGAVP